MKTRINSEIGKLEGVIIHTPGPEVENMTPENAERALYSDILNLSVASKEYAQLAGVLKSITKVFNVKELLSEVLNDEILKHKLIKSICDNEEFVCEREILNDKSAMQLTDLLVEGVVLEKNNLTNYLNNDRFSVRPLHNLFFTRDAAMGMNDKMLIGKMANRIREREAIIMEAIFNNHPDFETTTINPTNSELGLFANKELTIEGGDFQVAHDDIFVIGTGSRTSTQGIDFIIENIKQTKSEQHHIIVQELPSTPESFIHLDMVFTFLNTDSCMVYEPIIYKINQLRTIHIQIENRKVTKIEEVANIPTALKKLGMDLQPIYCGGNNDSWIQEREQWHSGTNFFAFAPGKVIGYERNVHTIEALNNNGFEVLKATDIIKGKTHPDNFGKCVVTIAGSELARGGGGARCMTMPVRRGSVGW